MFPVASVIVDFDGTACAHDAAIDLLDRFAPPDWREREAAAGAQGLPLRGLIDLEASMLAAPLEQMVAFVLDHCPLEPTFAPFVRGLRERNVDVAIASDGFGFYISPILEREGLGDVGVVTNTWRGEGTMTYGRAHPECVGCGTCKMNAVLAARSRGRVAFVGEGWSDRFAALYADVTFAKDVLVELAAADGVPFVAWSDFDDVMRALETMPALPGPVDPTTCPGWTVA